MGSGEVFKSKRIHMLNYTLVLLLFTTARLALKVSKLFTARMELSKSFVLWKMHAE
jgi:hypothetical protein